MTRMIRILPDEVAQKIAAGEVVERPVSVVKELVENSLDAEATEIRLELAEGGKKLIRVADNGKGMGPEDAAFCFKRHSTSKIETEEDLSRITTMGFRGEALASISSVSRVVLKTHDGSADRGTEIVREGEKLIGLSDIAFPKGTSIEVRDLFFNLPARRKFLRSDRAELALIVKYVTQAALAFPGIRFVATHGARQILDCPAVAGLKERIFQLYGKAVLDELMEIRYEESEDTTAGGFASKPFGGGADRAPQLLYVNRRPVRDRILQAAFKQAYAGFLEKGKSPTGFIFLSLPYSDVDVNVHPAKAEVRFKDPQLVFRLVLRGVESGALRLSGVKEVYPAAVEGASGSKVEEPPPGLPFRIREREEAPAPAPRAETREGPEVLGQYLNAYIIAGSEEGLFIIDQHNAHERVLFEKYLEIDKEKKWPAGILLLPILIDLSPSQALSFEENRPLLEGFGFRVEPMGGRSFVLKEHPAIFGPGEARTVFLAVLDEAGRTEAPGGREKILATLACKTAVKAGEPLPAEKMRYLVEELFKTSRPALCPHGRPVVLKLEKSQVEKGLGRRNSN